MSVTGSYYAQAGMPISVWCVPNVRYCARMGMT